MPRLPAAGCTSLDRPKRERRPKFNPRLAKIHFPYTVADVAQLFGVHQNTVFAWLDAGLQKVDDGGRPILILGSELRSFLESRSRKRRAQCGVGELYCFGCKAPRRPAGDTVDFERLAPLLGNLVGICPVCESIMNRGVNPSNLESICGDLEIVERNHCDA